MGAQPPSLNERLALIGLIDQGLRMGVSDSPIMSDLFDNLWELVSTTVSGSKIDLLKPENSRNGFRVFEAKAETGENIGHLNMLYMNKPIPCYYLVYVEVAAPFRKKGLGRRILTYFREFLAEKSAVGILDNIIPKDDPTFDIYSRRDWEPIENFIGKSGLDSQDNYMIYIPTGLKRKELKQPLLKLLYHLKRKRAAIDMRDNEVMVQRTIAEFKALYDSLMTYFQTELNRGDFSPLMRFMFTRFVTKLIAFRRRISELLGYTGGESLEQIRLSPEIDALPIQSYAPSDLAAQSSFVMGHGELWSHLPEAFKKHPARMIESLPNYQRPSFKSWLAKQGNTSGNNLTLGDLMDLGFDPTRLKEYRLDGEEFIFERMQARQVVDLNNKKELLWEINQRLPGLKVKNAWLKTNPPLLMIKDKVNTYVLRHRVSGIHWEEAIEQLQTDPSLIAMNESMRVDRIITATVRKSRELIEEQFNINERALNGFLTYFVSWDLTANRPRLMVDPAGAYFESIWLA